jgi:DNA adenine methylase
MNYPGGKNGSGVYQTIINLMPPHQCYIEGFLGSGAVMRNKKLAARNIGIEIDPIVAACQRTDMKRVSDNIEIYEGNFIKLLTAPVFPIFYHTEASTLLYLDPPYPLSTRRTQRQIYKYEMLSDDEHIELLEMILPLQCMVMISSYSSDLYNDYLQTWRKVEFPTTNRAGHKVTECVWLNFPEPLELHDYSFLGENRRERERIKRKRLRWRNRLETMPNLERHALMAEIANLRSDRVSSNLATGAGESGDVAISDVTGLGEIQRR